MGTEKRERQKANRLQRQIEEARAERIGTIRRNVLRWGIGIVLAIGAVVFIAWIGGAFSGDDEPDVATDEPAVDTTPTTSTIAPLPAPPKPEVEIPAELPAELVVTDLAEGDGIAAAVGDTVLVHYVGVRSEDGVEFDSNYDGAPFPVQLGFGGVIQGWDQGLVGVQVGTQRQLDIPPALSYGEAARGDIIRENEALTFVIDVVGITPAASG